MTDEIAIAPAEATTSEPEQIKARILIGIASGEKQIEKDCFLRWVTLLLQWGAAGYACIGTSDGPVFLVRELLTKQFLANPEYTHLLMLDTDHLHPEDVVERMVRWLGHPSRPLVVGGLNYQRKVPYRPACFMFDPDGDKLGLLTLTSWPAGLVKVDAVGASCLLIAREVFERIPAPYWEFSYRGGRLVGEDIGFCHACGQAGIAVYCDTTTTSPHAGREWVTDATFRAWAASHAEEMGQPQQIQTEGHQIVTSETERELVPA